MPFIHDSQKHSQQKLPQMRQLLVVRGKSLCSLVSPEKQCYGTWPRMGSDNSADTVDHDLPIKLWKFLFYHIRHFSGVFHAGGIGDKAFAAVVQSSLGMLLHPLHHFPDHLFLPSVLIPGDQLSFAVHIHQRADIQRLPKES